MFYIQLLCVCNGRVFYVQHYVFVMGVCSTYSSYVCAMEDLVHVAREREKKKSYSTDVHGNPNEGGGGGGGRFVVT